MSGLVQVMAPSFTTLLLKATTPNLAFPDEPELVIGDAASGVITSRHGRLWLVTAAHVLTGRHSESGRMLDEVGGAVPKHLAIRLPHESKYDAHYWIQQPLYSARGQPRWREHPLGPRVDVAALPLTSRTHFLDPKTLKPHRPKDQFGEMHAPAKFITSQVIRPELPWELDVPLGQISLDVTDDLHVVGFPFGLTGGAGLAIWTHAFIATEIQFNHDDLPMFLVDARTRKGQSGGPVIFFSRSGMFPTRDGVDSGLGSNLMRFMGVYSGRIRDDSDLGRVFRRDAVLDVLERGVRPLPRL